MNITDEQGQKIVHDVHPKQVKRIGLFGGSFDPIHNGHLHIAKCALIYCHLDEVVFIPTAAPPHKNPQAVSSFRHRVAMIQLAIADHAHFTLSTIESCLSKPSYTVDTLRYFQDQLSAASTDFFFIIGADAFLEIGTWKSYRQVVSLTNFVVCDRTGVAAGTMHDCLDGLGYRPDGESVQSWTHPLWRTQIFLMKQTLVDTSSSYIRQSLKDKGSALSLMPVAVLAYIQSHGLYA